MTSSPRPRACSRSPAWPPGRLLAVDGALLRACLSHPDRRRSVGSPAVTEAVENARRGVITHLTVGGERVAAIVPESVIEALRAAEDAEDAAEADAAWEEPGESIPLEELEAEFGM